MKPLNYDDEVLLFRTFLTPVVFFSATAILTASLNVRLTSIVSRLRHYMHAVNHSRQQEVEAYTDQIHLIQRRAELLRRALIFALLALTGTLLSCLLLGLGIYSNLAAESAAIVFVLYMISLIVCIAFYMREVTDALRAAEEEAHDLFTDAAREVSAYPGIGKDRNSFR